MRSGSVEAREDRTAAAVIAEAALALFADRGADAVTVREIAAEAGVSPGLVLHHYGSKDGLRAAVDERAARAFDAVLDQLGDDGLVEGLDGQAASLAEAFAAGFPPGSPLPAYLRRLLLTGDDRGREIFRRWFDLSLALLDRLEERGVARPAGDRQVRAAFLLVNDLAPVLLAPHLAAVLGTDPTTTDGMRRWAAEATDVYAHGAFRLDEEET
jgi:AcrR family transcriptional regulator